MTYEAFKKIIFFNLLFFIFHFISWKFIQTLDTSYVLLFFGQFLIFSILYVYIKKDIFIAIVSFPLIVLYLISVIAFIDRSLTVEMMIYYLNGNTAYSDLYEIDKLTTNFLIDKRIDEQLTTDLINYEEGLVSLTKKGRFFANIYKFLTGFYN